MKDNLTGKRQVVHAKSGLMSEGEDGDTPFWIMNMLCCINLDSKNI